MASLEVVQVLAGVRGPSPSPRVYSHKIVFHPSGFPLSFYASSPFSFLLRHRRMFEGSRLGIQGSH